MKILFIGFADSSHTRSWIDLLAGTGADIRLFGISGHYPPERLPVRTTVLGEELFSTGKDGCAWRMRRRVLRRLINLEAKTRRMVARLSGREAITAGGSRMVRRLDRRALVSVVKDFRPDIVHTLGLEHAGTLFSQVRDDVAGHYGTWVATVRGSELTLPGLLPEDRTRDILSSCAVAVVDSQHSQDLAQGYCAQVHRFPGSGGVDIPDKIAGTRERMILWPKAFDFWGSTSLPVLEAIRLCWEKIAPCTIHLTAMDERTRKAVEALPEVIRASLVTHERISRRDLLALMAQARVMLAPSLSDGIPNVLYEAMAYGALPVLSPLDTIREIAEEGRNALFAQNRSPDEIAAALTRAMNDDALFRDIQKRNRSLVAEVADRKILAENAIRLYTSLLETARKRQNDVQ